MARKFGQKREICIDPLAYNIGLIGESGIGKSTVIKEVCEKLAGDEGYIALDIGKEDGHDAINGIVSAKIPDWATFKEFCDDVIENKLTDYKDLRASENENSGEHIFMIQREAQDAGAPFHFGLLPYPEQPISITPAYGGGLAPCKEFYESYDDQDIRKRNEEFFYTSKPKYGDPETTITLDVPYLCKYWDENAESTGKSGANIPVYRYADVLLMCAEAKATLDGGSTSDATAVDAYFQVRHRRCLMRRDQLRSRLIKY